MPRGGGQSGQATIEWAGLMLCVALVLGALLAGGRSAAKGEAGRGLGEAVAERITCAVRGACEAEAGMRLPRTSLPRREPSPHREPSRGLAHAAPVLKRTWFGCIAYRSWQDNRENPRLLGEARPVKRTVHILNECVNPLSFLFGK